jgi:uncharacterized RDD family membrane protein YckC
MAEPYRDPTAILPSRLAAWLLDGALIGAVIFFAQGFALRSGEQFPGRPSDCDLSGNVCINSGSDSYLLEGSDASTYRYLLIGAVVLAAVNYVVLQGLTGATVGKFALGIRTINSKDEPAGIFRCLVRTMFSWVDFLCSGLVGLVTYFRSQNHRRVADMIGGTTVVRKGFVAQRVAAVESAEAARAAALQAAEARRGAFIEAEPYPGAYTAPPGGALPDAPPGFGGRGAAWRPPEPTAED